MRARETQRGSVLATAAVVLAGLIGIAGLTVLSIQRGIGISGQQRGRAQALHAAEAGVLAASAYLRTKLLTDTNWSAFVVPDCAIDPLETTAECPDGVAPPSTDLVGNFAPPGDDYSPFEPDCECWYEVTLFNNVDDPGLTQGTDTDKVLLIRSVGRGPDGARVVLEVEVEGTDPGTPNDQLCVGYAQQGMSELNSGRNDCFRGLAASGDVDPSQIQTYTPSTR